MSGPPSMMTCLFLAPSYLDNRKKRDEMWWCSCLREWCSQFYFRDGASGLAVRSYISCSLHRLLRITLTNSTPHRPDKCLHYAREVPDSGFWHQRRNSNDKQLSSVVILRDMMTSRPLSRMTNTTMMRLLRLGQLEMGNIPRENFSVNAKSPSSQEVWMFLKCVMV